MSRQRPAHDAREAAEKAAVLIESLPWLKRFRDQIIVIKYGGNAMVSEELQDAFAQDIAYLRFVGVKPVVVHGGGPQISQMLDRLAIPSEFKGGYRVTSTEAMSVVRMVLTGQVNPQLVARINAYGPFAAGCRVRTRASSADAAAASSSTAPSTTSAPSAMSSVDPQPVLDQLAAGASRSSPRSPRPRPPGALAERQRGCRGGGPRDRARRGEARRPHRRRGPLRRLAEPRLARLAPDRRRAARCCRGSSRG
jgi:hypothetical protein